MSFKCQHCGIQQPVGQPVNYVVTETRQKTYQNEVMHGKMRGTMEETTGTEIVKQIEACPSCYRELTGQEPRVIIPVQAVSKSPKVHERPGNRKPWHNPRNNKSFRSSPSSQKKPPRPAPVVEVVNKVTLIKE